MNRRHFLATIPAAAPLAAAGAQDAPAGDEAAIRAVVRRYVDARDARDPKEIEALLAPEADQLVSDGTWRRGRDALVRGMLESSASNPARRTIAVEAVRMIAADVAVADGRYVQEGPSGAAPRAMWTSITLKKGADGWRIEAIRNMLPVATPKADAIPDDADPQVVLDEARELAGRGKFEEALQRYVWFHENAVRVQPSMGAVRRSFALAGWAELGEKYPKAREALVAVRDQDVATLRAGKGTVDSFADALSISNYLDETPVALDLFKQIDAEKPKLASRCYIYAEEALAAAKEYALCSKYITDPAGKFRLNIQVYRMTVEREKTQDERFPRTAAARFAESACRLIGILVAAGRKPEALEVQRQALEVRDDPRIRGAVAAAEAEAPK